MHGTTVEELWLARAPRRPFPRPTGTRAASRRLTRAGLRRSGRVGPGAVAARAR